MKKTAFIKCLAFVYMFAGLLISCSSELDNVANDYSSGLNNSLFAVDDIKSEMKSCKSDFDLNSLPPLQMDKIRGLLNRLDGLTFSAPERTNTGTDGNMVCYTLSNSAEVDNDNSVVITLDMITYTDDNSLYYKNNTLSVVGSDMYMVSKGFSLSTGKDINHYHVSVNGTVYFKLMDKDGHCSVVSQDVKVIGSLDIENNSTSYICSL